VDVPDVIRREVELRQMERRVHRILDIDDISVNCV
jgi:hypothetical protein